MDDYLVPGSARATTTQSHSHPPMPPDRSSQRTTRCGGSSPPTYAGASDLQASATVSDRVRAALNETLPAGDPSIGAVTAQLATSARTLQRQLSQEGTSFQAVLANTPRTSPGTT